MKNSTSRPDRNAIRFSLYDNGYDPLPLCGKACYIKGWSFAEINPDFLKEHARRGAWTNTGIRCGHVVGIDIDIDDAGLAGFVEGLVEEALGPTAFCRFGKGEKRLLAYWNESPIPKLRTKRYTRDDGLSVQVEVLGTGNQFVAYGTHPDTGEPYQWTDWEPLRHDADSLPLTTPDKLRQLVTILDQHFTGAADLAEDKALKGGGDGSHDYCLTPEDEFEVLSPGMGLMSVAELREALPHGETWECNLTAIRPDSDSGAGRISWSHLGTICVHDFVTGVTYFEALDFDEAGQIMGNLLPAQPEQGLFDNPKATLYRLLEECVYVAADGTVRYLDDPTRGFKRDNFKFMYTQKVIGPNATPVALSTAWLQHRDCIKCLYAQLRPDQPKGVFDLGGRRRGLNLYVPPQHDTPGGDTAVFHEFMVHLIPDGRERDLVIDWIATKVQKPWKRLHGLVMVAPGVFGTGRGTLGDILGALLGPQYCTETTLEHLTGTTGQAQYNDYLSQSLLVTIPEAMNTDEIEKGRWRARKEVYEQIKLVVDTGTRSLLIRRKGVHNTSEVIYASILISTNHADAVAIEEGDRRLIVISNTLVPLAQAPNNLRERIHAWWRNEANISALYRELLARATLRYDAEGEPPMTPAKQRMIQSNQSSIDMLWNLFVERAEGDICTLQQWRQFAMKTKAEYDLDFPDVRHLDKTLERVLSTFGQRIYPDDPLWQIRVKVTRARPWLIRNFATWQTRVTHATSCHSNEEQNRLHEEIRAEILKNGDPGGTVVELPKRT